MLCQGSMVLQKVYARIRATKGLYVEEGVVLRVGMFYTCVLLVSSVLPISRFENEILLFPSLSPLIIHHSGLT